MIELNPEQQQALDAGRKLLRVVDPRTNTAYVILPADLYDRLQALLYDDSPWGDEETLRLLAESGRRAGWDAPEMDDYDNYDEAHHPVQPRPEGERGCER